MKIFRITGITALIILAVILAFLFFLFKLFIILLPYLLVLFLVVWAYKHTKKLFVRTTQQKTRENIVDVEYKIKK